MNSKKKFQKVELSYWWDKNYKKLLIFPLILFLFSVSIFLYKKPTLGRDFTGGKSYTLQTNLSYTELMNELSKYKDVEIKSIGNGKYIIETPYDFDYNLSKIGKIESVMEISPEIGKEFYSTAIWMIIIGFTLLITLVFISFRTFVPATLMILSIAFDTLFALAMITLFEIPISLATISIILLLVGYSIDTDILLTTRVLKRKELDLNSRFLSSFKTGLTMQITALIVMLLVYTLTSLFFPVLELVKQISFILVSGIFADIIFTWCFNATTLRIWYERHEKTK